MSQGAIAWTRESLARLDPEELRLERARRAIGRLSSFVRYMWHIVEPATPLVWAPYLDAICDHLEAVSQHRIRNLIVNIPPRHLKSTIVSVMWPAWEWVLRPATRWLTSSYKLPLATRDARRARKLMGSAEYRELLEMAQGPDGVWELEADQNVKTRYENTRTGWRICTSVGAGGTGEGGDIVAVDDPNDIRHVHSERKRAVVHEWWDETMSTRLNDAKTSAKVVIMQRCHGQDLTGHILEKDGTVDLLCMPTEFEPDHPTPSRTTLGYVDPRTVPGELLAPDRMGEVEVANAKLVLGSWGYVGQHQQRPKPKGGGVLKESCFLRRWTVMPLQFDYIWQSWDLNFGTKNAVTYRDRSWVVGYVLGLSGATTYVLDEVRGVWEFSQSLLQMMMLTDRWPMAMKKLVENKANGPALESILRNRVPGIELVEPKGGKLSRALAIQPYAEAGGILLPSDLMAPWARPAIDEFTAFPFGTADDRVDALSQGVVYALPKTQAGVLERYRALTAQ